MLCARRQVLAMLLVALCGVGGSSTSAQQAGLYRELYTSVTGSTLFSLTNIVGLLDNPDPGAVVITNLFENPSNFGDNYGARWRGLLIPPVTGSYVFWVQGQNAAQLYLSSDESPLNKVTIGYNLSSALARAWYVFESQQSPNIFLEAGKRYYLEALHKTGNGDDSFAVGWKLPNGTYRAAYAGLALSALRQQCR